MKKKQNDSVQTHCVAVRESIANRIVNDAKGLLIVENSDRQYQKGDLLTFDVGEDGVGLKCFAHPLADQVYRISGVYSGRGIEPGYVALLIDYFGPNKESDKN